jgi:ketosteroid isomerase-like protein
MVVTLLSLRYYWSGRRWSGRRACGSGAPTPRPSELADLGPEANSQQNIEIVRRVIDAWNRRDLDTMLSLSDPKIEYVNDPAAIEPGIRRGRAGLEAVLRAQWEGLPGARQEVERVHARGDEVLSVTRLSRLMPGSEARLENRMLMSWTIRDRRVVRVAVLGAGPTFDTALEAAGLGGDRP